MTTANGMFNDLLSSFYCKNHLLTTPIRRHQETFSEDYNVMILPSSG